MRDELGVPLSENAPLMNCFIYPYCVNVPAAVTDATAVPVGEGISPAAIAAFSISGAIKFWIAVVFGKPAIALNHGLIVTGNPSTVPVIVIISPTWTALKTTYVCAI
jgi:hypothetical protein